MILYEDDSWLAVDKPTGLPTHNAHPGDLGASEWLALHTDRNLHIFSRLDKDTSGVLLFAKTKAAASLAQSVHDEQLARKVYIFISDRPCSAKKEEWENTTPLDKKESSTRFRLLDEGGGYYLYQAVIERGRTHQIRRHAALSGVPIVGDNIYGDTPFSRLCLHCQRVEWPGISDAITSSVPDSFRFLLQGAAPLLLSCSTAWEHRMAWPLAVSNCCRLIHRGEIDLPVSIDLYDRSLSIINYDSSINAQDLLQQLSPVLEFFSTKVHYQSIALRRHARNPHQKKLIHDVTYLGQPLPEHILAREHDLYFDINLNDTQHTGLFLDQRDSRRRIHLQAKGKRVANLFSFTCSFSAAAAAGGAEVVFSVDLAASALTRGKENFALNDLTREGRGKFIKEDVGKWLTRQERKKNTNPKSFSNWDLIICDPPVFSSAGKGKGFHVEKQWIEMARQVRFLLSDTGAALFANNHRGGNSAYYLGELEQYFSKVTQLKPPLDFPVLETEPEHVRIYWCEV